MSGLFFFMLSFYDKIDEEVKNMQKIYLENPYLQEFDTKLKRKFTKDGKEHAVFEATIFYPHMSGGQPKDTGTINRIQVSHVYEEDDEIIHVLEEPLSGTKAHMKIDFDRRFQHMQEHTAQHIFAGLARKIYGVESIGFHMAEDHSSTDLAPESALPEGWIRNLEDLTQQVIEKSLPVKKFYTNERPENLRSKMPNTKDPARIVEIEGADLCACAGTHVDYTGELFSFRVIRTKSFPDKLRVYYIAGRRAYREYRDTFHQLSRAADEFQTSISSVMDRLMTAKEERDRLQEENRQLKDLVLLGEIHRLNSAKEHIRALSYIFHIYDDPPVPITQIGEGVDADLVFLGHRDGQIYLRVSDKDYSLNPIIEQFKDRYHVKGGGSAIKYQGKAEDSEGFLQAILNEVARQMR